jgi:hypothetical protein
MRIRIISSIPKLITTRSRMLVVAISVDPHPWS